MKGNRLLIFLATLAALSCSSGTKRQTTDAGTKQDTFVDTGKIDADTKAPKQDIQHETGSDADISMTDTAPQIPDDLTFHNCDGKVDLEKVPKRQFIIAPYLILPRQHGITIQFEAMDNGPAYILWGREGQITDCTCVTKPRHIPIDSPDISEQDDGWLYRVDLDGLDPHTRYVYTLWHAQVPVPDPAYTMNHDPTWMDFGFGHFITAPKPDTPFEMTVYGDNQPLTLVLKSIIKELLGMETEFHLHTGDIVHNGTVEEYRYNFFLVAWPFMKNVPHLLVAGNHENDGSKLPFDGFFPVPGNEPVTVDGKTVNPGPRTGFLDYGNARFFVMDSENDMTKGSPQYEWLNAKLKDTVQNHPEIRWIFVAWHRPIFSNADRVWEAPRKDLRALMAHWKVDVVWNGHNHLYEHFLQDGVHYVITGGGGAALRMDVNGGKVYPGDNRVAVKAVFHVVHGKIGKDKASFEAIDIKGNKIDSFTITAKDRSHIE